MNNIQMANCDDLLHRRILAFRTYGPGAPMNLEPIIGESVFGERTFGRCLECKHERTIFVMYDNTRDIKPMEHMDMAILTVRPKRVCCFDCFEHRITSETAIIQIAFQTLIPIPSNAVFVED